MYRLFGHRGWGSALIEAQLAWYGLPFEFEDVGNPFKSTRARADLAAINPAGQMPALILPDGALMTESAAITLLLAETVGRDDLVPAPGSPDRGRFLRWLTFMVANVYPTFTYADVPARFVAAADAQAGYVEAVAAWRARLWGILEAEVGTPWVLGERFCALDIYVAVMTRWTPRRDWFAVHSPNLARVAAKVDAVPALTPVWSRNFRTP